MRHSYFRLKIILLALGCIVFLAHGCGSDSQKRKVLSYSFACDEGFERRQGSCVRTADQCLSNNVETDGTCKKVPCNNGLYFDGRFCSLLESPVPDENTDEDSGDAPTPAPGFTDLCLSTSWSAEETYTHLGTIRFGLEQSKLIGQDGWTLAANEQTCAVAKDEIFSWTSAYLPFPATGLESLAPILVFEYAENVGKVLLSVSESTLMDCPLTDKTRCLFEPFQPTTEYLPE